MPFIKKIIKGKGLLVRIYIDIYIQIIPILCVYASYIGIRKKIFKILK